MKRGERGEEMSGRREDEDKEIRIMRHVDERGGGRGKG